jgi:hypothetical protein
MLSESYTIPDTYYTMPDPLYTLPPYPYFEPPAPLSGIPWLPENGVPPPPWLDPNNPGFPTNFVTQESFNAAINEILQSLDALNQTIFSLHGGMAFIYNASVAIHSNQVAMAETMSEVTDSLSEVAASLTEITTTISEISATAVFKHEATGLFVILGGVMIALVIALIFATSWKFR